MKIKHNDKSYKVVEKKPQVGDYYLDFEILDADDLERQGIEIEDAEKVEWVTFETMLGYGQFDDVYELSVVNTNECYYNIAVLVKE